MPPVIACLHAHHSNIAFLDAALGAQGFAATHYVDPGTVHRLTTDPGLSRAEAAARLQDQLSWMAACGADGILVTCTNYAAVVSGAEPPLDVPVVHIDEPLLAALCEREEPQVLLFTNAATVSGTMERLAQYAAARGRRIDVRPELIDGAFALVLQGRAEEYRELVIDRLKALLAADPACPVWVGQLSMTEAARSVADSTGLWVGDPLTPLMQQIAERVRRV